MINKDTDFFKIIDNFAKTANIPSIQIITSDLEFKPKISIIIPTYKRGGLLKEAIDSAMHQIGYENYDILVVDNDPERYCDTEKLLMSYNCSRLNYYKNTENIGMFGNWNRCIELARGDWVCMLHDDDMLEESYLQDLFKVIKNKPNAGLIACRLKILSQNQNDQNTIIIRLKRLVRIQMDNTVGNLTKISRIDYLYGFKSPVVGSCFKKELALKIGGFNASYFPSADYFFIANFQHKFNNVYFLRKKNYIYRIFDNESLNINTSRQFFIIDYHFINYLIKINKYKFHVFLYFLNKQYVIIRLGTQKKIYNNDGIDLDSILNELGISKNYKYFPLSVVGGLLFRILGLYRAIFKY